MNILNENFLEFLEKNHFMSLFRKTVEENRNLWNYFQKKVNHNNQENVAKLIQIVAPNNKPLKTLFKILSRTTRMGEILEALEQNNIAQKIETTLNNFPNTMLAILEDLDIEKSYNLIKKIPKTILLLEKLNFHKIKALIKHEKFLRKIEKFAKNNIDYLSLLDICFNKNGKISEGFIDFLLQTKKSYEVVIETYKSHGFELIQKIDELSDNNEMTKRTHQSIFKRKISQKLLNILKEAPENWCNIVLKQIIQENLIEPLKIYENQELCLKALLNLCIKHKNDGPKRIQILIKTLNHKKITKQINKECAEFIIDNLVFIQQNNYATANLLIKLAETKEITQLLKTFAQLNKPFIPIIESKNSNIYEYFMNNHINLITTIDLLEDFNAFFENSNYEKILKYLEKIKPEQKYLIYAVLKNSLQHSLFNEKFYNRIVYSDLGNAINNLSNYKDAENFLDFIYNNNEFITILDFNQQKNGALKLNAFVKGLCDQNNNITSRFIQSWYPKYNRENIMLNLIYKNKDNQYIPAKGFILALEHSNHNISEMLDIFSYKDFWFVRLIEKLFNGESENKFYEIFDKININYYIMELYNNQELFISFLMDFACKTRPALLLKNIKKIKHPILYQNLILLLPQIEDDEFQELECFASKDIIKYELDYKKFLNFTHKLQSSKIFRKGIELALITPNEMALFILMIYDKDNTIEALNKLTPISCKVIIKEIRKDDILQQLEQSPFIIPFLFFDDPTNREEPVTACYHFIQMLKNLKNKDILKELDSEIIIEFEKAFTRSSYKSQALFNKLIQSEIFISTLKSLDKPSNNSLLKQIFGDPNEKILSFYDQSPELFIPLLSLYFKIGSFEKICQMKNEIALNDIKYLLLSSFIDPAIDHSSKLLRATLTELGVIGKEGYLEIYIIRQFHYALIEIFKLKNALIRFSNRKNININQIRKLIKLLMSKGYLYTCSHTLNEHFLQKQNRTAIVEDNYIYQYFLQSQQ